MSGEPPALAPPSPELFEFGVYGGSVGGSKLRPTCIVERPCGVRRAGQAHRWNQHDCSSPTTPRDSHGSRSRVIGSSRVYRTLGKGLDAKSSWPKALATPCGWLELEAWKEACPLRT